MYTRYKVQGVCDGGAGYLSANEGWKPNSWLNVVPEKLFYTEKEAQECVEQYKDKVGKCKYVSVEITPRDYQKYSIYVSPGAVWALAPTQGDLRDNYPDRSIIRQGVVYCEGSLKDCLKKSQSLYAAVSRDNSQMSPWYFSREEAYIESDGRRIIDKGGKFVRAWFDEQECFPLYPPFPACVEVDKKGGPCLFLTPHPEIDGNHCTRKKIYFPDKSMGPVHFGPIVVTQLRDKGNYGFFKGEQPRRAAPSTVALAEYCKRYSKEAFTFMMFEHEIWGSYVILGPHLDYQGKGGSCIILVESKDGTATEDTSLECADLGDAEVVWTRCGADLELAAFVGISSLQELRDRLVPIDFSLVSVNYQASMRPVSEAFENAVKMGAFVPAVFHHVEMVVPSVGLNKLGRFTKAVVEDMIAYVNQTNTEANKRLHELVQSGELKLTARH